MNYDILSNIEIILSDDKKKLFEEYIKLFINYNEHTNLVSKNDINFLFEKHELQAFDHIVCVLCGYDMFWFASQNKFERLRTSFS